jgi:hypothetical protein
VAHDEFAMAGSLGLRSMTAAAPVRSPDLARALKPLTRSAESMLISATK